MGKEVHAGTPGEIDLPLDMRLTLSYFDMERDRETWIKVPALNLELFPPALMLAVAIRRLDEEPYPLVRFTDRRDGSWKLSVVSTAVITDADSIPALSFGNLFLTPALGAGHVRLSLNAIIGSALKQEIADEFHAADDTLIIRFFEEGCCRKEELVYETMALDIGTVAFPLG